MEINELKSLISNKYEEASHSFGDLIRDEGWEAEGEPSFYELTGLKFEFLDSERTRGGGDHDGYVWRFKIDGKTYEVGGSYDSWNGTSMDDANAFYEVELVEKTIKVWQPV